MKSALRSPLLVAALAVAVTVVLELGVFQVLRPLDNRLNDLTVRTHGAALEPDPDIVLIDIDEGSLERMARHEGRYPWPRSIHAEVLEAVAAQQPGAIVFDIVFSDPDMLRPGSDAYFVETAQAVPVTYFACWVITGGAGEAWPEDVRALGFEPEPGAHSPTTSPRDLVLPLPGIAATGRLGTINFIEDDDGIGRRYSLFTPSRGWRIPSLPARIARDLDWAVPDGEDFLLHWRGGRLPHTRVPYADLYEDINRRVRQRPADEFRDKIVIIGATAPALHDLRATPVASLTPAVGILATAIDNLRNQRFMRQLPASWVGLLALLLIGLLFAAFARVANPLRIGLGLMLITLGVLASGYVAVTQRLLVPVVTPLLFAWAYYAIASLYEYLRERRTREQSVQMFSRFLDPRVVSSLIADADTSTVLASQSREITVLFSDIRGFTTLSEKRSAEDIVALLNRYFSRQVEVIFRHGGTMDKFIGDAIMAFWGAPMDEPQHARRAVDAALEMQDALRAFREELGGDLGEGFDVGIGIHSGTAVVGFIGSDNKLDYTAIGDTVNLASRIEGQTKTLARILVSAETRARCRDAFDFVDHGSYKVKGREQPVQLFEPRRRSP